MVMANRGERQSPFFAVLHVPPITTPLDAMRAAIVAEQRSGKHS